MTASLTLACVWAVVATVIAMLPGRFHWRAAYVLIALGIPLVGWVTYQNGPYIGMIVLAGGVSVLRWPVIYLFRWLKGRSGSPAE
ncbi:DUF2484 family protein [Pseudotabrizicola sp. L79]|uniref:DUF2484 family protein n=1 Tax=Pseudotabrizicola sp. L79 TaxID=3118402 RepID=UPI002F92473D